MANARKDFDGALQEKCGNAFVKGAVLEALEKRSVAVVRHEPITEVLPHGHNCIELSYVTAGRVIHTLDGNETVLLPGDYIIVDYGSVHSYRTENGGLFSNVDCLFLPKLLDPALAGAKSLRMVLDHYLIHFSSVSAVENPAHFVFHDDDRRILGILERMMEEASEIRPGFTEMMRCQLAELLILTVRKIAGRASPNSEGFSGFITAYVAEHYAEPISLSEIVRKMGYSLSYVSRCFRAETGMTFMEYLQNYRIMQACRLLSDTSATVDRIAEQVGYGDVKHFSTLLRRYTGLCSRDFRKRSK